MVAVCRCNSETNFIKSMKLEQLRESNTEKKIELWNLLYKQSNVLINLVWRTLCILIVFAFSSICEENDKKIVIE